MSGFSRGGTEGGGNQPAGNPDGFQPGLPEYGRPPQPPTAQTSSGTKPSWSELKTHVRTTRRDLSSLSARVPTMFAFRTMPKDPNHTRLYFLAALQMGRETSLFYIDVKGEEVSSSGGAAGAACAAAGAMPSLMWNPLIETSFQLGRVSREEELQLERKRCAAFGITSYELDTNSGAFVFPAAGTLFGCKDSDAVPSPVEIKTGLESARLNPTICPTNPDLIAFASNGDIWVTNLKTGQEVELTKYHQGGPIMDDPLSAGLPSYVTQEEFSRFNSFWWRPVQPGSESGIQRFTLLYEMVDDSNVDVLRFPVAGSTDVEEFRFPKAGSHNSVSRLKIVQFRVSPGSGAIVDVETYTFDLHKYFPWLEYLVRVGWTPDGRHVWAQLLDRPQQHMDLVLIPVNSFTLEEPAIDARRKPDSHLLQNSADERFSPPLQVIYRATSEAWINVSDILTFMTAKPSFETEITSSTTSAAASSAAATSSDLNSQNATSGLDTVTFIISAENTSWKHLYLVTSKIYPPGCINPSNEKEFFDTYLTPHVVSKTALTQGQWCVHDKIWVDEKNRLVYFHGYREDPLENHLYVVSIDQPLNVVRLTDLGCSHSVMINTECNLLVTVFSSVHNPPSCCVFRIRNTNGTAEGVHLSPVGCLHESKPPDELTNYKFPELFSYKISSGDKLCGMMFKPHQIDQSPPGKKYPVVLCVYGGPEVQLVTNTFEGMRQMRSHLLAQEGYYVVSIDSRGSCNRGLAFEAHLRFRMGQVELQDQVEVLRWLGANTPSMDLDRVAIHGWSYGGYLSLIGLVSYPDLFKVSVAGAPVTSWMHYDTGYTERYMGLPANNSWGYNLGSVVARASEFPDEPNRLLIIHGLMDENVHFYQHTAPLLQALVKHGKPYQLQIYPNERHSLRRLDASEQYETTLLFFLQSNL